MGIVIQVKEGLLEGLDRKDHWQFRGVPFAKPPVGELRFREPQPCESWEGVRKADTFPPMPIQYECTGMDLYGKEFYNHPDFLPEKSEDCLYLNIWCPPKRENHKSAVAVWIHGGAFHHGWSSEMEFDGAAYCKRDVILVSVEYRLGVFGLLTFPGEEYCGNYGILDQIAAITWVKENIAAFGGDPENITIMGQSAGAVSVQMLCCMDMTKGLFQKAVMQSGAGLGLSMSMEMSLEKGQLICKKLLQNLGLSDMEELRQTDAEKIFNVYQKLSDEENLRCSFCLDGKLIRKNMGNLIRTGKMQDIPYLLGSNSEDLSGENGEKKLLEATIALAEICREQGKKVPYIYYFSHQLPGSSHGAFHSAELWYTFSTLDRCWRPMAEEDYALAEEMTDAWCNFIKDGKPGGDWENYEKSGIKEFT